MIGSFVRARTALAVGAAFVAATGCRPQVVNSPAPADAPNAAGEQTGTFVRQTPPSDPVIRRIMAEGMDSSRTEFYAQRLLDSIGPRLQGSPGSANARAWMVKMYGELGIPARQERYGTWAAWRRGAAHVDLITPRVRSLESTMLGWSAGTGGRPVEGEVVVLPDVQSPEEYRAWLPTARGKFVLTSPERFTCRSDAQVAQFATPETRASLADQQRQSTQGWATRNVAAGGPRMQAAMKEAGVAGVLSSYWSGYPGVQKIFGSWRQELPTFDIGCEDYNLLFRMAEADQNPRIRVTADAESLGEQPVFNVIAEMRGTEKPDEYVMLSAHFDSWDGASGATDNGTGTLVMLEAMRILKKHYPNPKRTIIVGHWGGEEQGLNGSRAFTEDHPEVVRGLHALWNQDNGTGRILNMSPGPFVNARPVLARYLGEIPAEITRSITLGPVGGQATGGTDHASFMCHRAPGFNLGALSWDYGNTTWHTNRDTYDKIIFDDLKNNATLTAMLAYLSSEDPTLMPRDIVSPLPAGRTGQPTQWVNCAPATRSTAQSSR